MSKLEGGLPPIQDGRTKTGLPEDPEAIQQVFNKRLGVATEDKRSRVHASLEEQIEALRFQIDIEMRQALEKYETTLANFKKIEADPTHTDYKNIESWKQMAKEALEEKFTAMEKRMKDLKIN